MTHLLGLGGDNLLNISDALLEDLLKNLRVLKLLGDLGDDAISELLLLTLLNLSLVADPGVKNLLGLVGKSSGLLKLVSLGLKLSSFLRDSEQLLGDVNDTSQLLDVLNASLDSRGVICASRVQDVLDLVDLTLGPLLVHWSTVLSNGEENAAQTESDNGLLVDDIVLVAERVDGGTGTGGEDGSLGDQRVSWEGVND